MCKYTIQKGKFMSNDVKIASLIGQKFKSDKNPIYTIMTGLNSYDTNPPYQRAVAWREPMQIAVIKSIMNKLPIGSLHFVMKPNGHQKWVMDGKQRLTAIESFMNNEFCIPIIDNGSSNIEVPLTAAQEENMTGCITWSDIQDSRDQRIKQLEKKFFNHNVEVVDWDTMSILEQRDIFNQINAQESLSNNEKIYCSEFMARKLFSFFFDECLQPMAQHIKRKEVRTNYRYTGTRFAQHICTLCYGYHLNEKFDIRDIGGKKTKEAAKDIHEKFIQKGIGENKIFDLDLVESFGYREIYDSLKRMSAVVDDVMRGEIVTSNTSTFKNSHDSNTLMDLLCFFIKKEQEGVITPSFVRENKKVFGEFACKYYRLKAEKQLSHRSVATVELKARYDTLETTWNELELDKGVKNKLPSNIDHVVARLESNGKCPVCGDPLYDDTIALDHVKPKSKFSETPFVYTCKRCNGTKSNLTLANVKQVGDYIQSEIKE
jgi:hypothetical protein